jgi:mRNA interferase MazF
MKVQRGDVIIVDHPYGDASGSKVRPALVVQGDADNARMTNTILAMITKNLSRVHEPSQLLVDVATPDGRASGLSMSSAVTCSNLFTVHEDRIRRKIGQLSPALMLRINDCLKVALDLP